MFTFVTKRAAALDAAEALGVPVLVQGSHHFLSERQSTGYFRMAENE